MIDPTLIQQAADLLNQSQRIAILTGAGVSKESGVPTFRDVLDGLWSKYDPQQLATPTAFKNNPKLVWDWYQFRRELMRDAKPNPGHIALAELEKLKSETWLITQNVDDLHEQAGSKKVIHLHGNIARNKCFYACRGEPTLIDIRSLTWEEDAGPPACPHCGRWVRPDVVWFGEMLTEQALEHALQVAQECDVMLVVGTSGLVSPASQLPGWAGRSGGKIIEVNPDYSMITSIADIKLEAPSGEILPRVLEAMA